MWMILVAVLANVAGSLALLLAFLLLSPVHPLGRAGLSSRRGLGVLCLLAAGGLLAVSGQYRLSKALYDQAARVRAEARLRSVLQEPLEELTVHVHGPDLFRDRPSVCALRLRIATKVGTGFVSEVPASRLARATDPQQPDAYVLAWQSIVEGIPDEKGRAVAARLGRVNDWRRVHHLEVEIIAQTPESISLPDSLQFAPGSSPSGPAMFSGTKTFREARRQGDAWVNVYHANYTVADQIKHWGIANEQVGSPPSEPDLSWEAALVAAVLALAAGLGLLKAGPQDPGGRLHAP